MIKASTENTENINKATSSLALECTSVSKKYGSLNALKGVNIGVEKGHIVGLLGPDGAGKTSLVKLICGLTRGGRGKILVDGKRIRPKDISYQPEYPFVNSNQRVGDLFEMYRAFYSDFNAKRASALLKKAEISLDDKFGCLSRTSIQKAETIFVMSRNAKLYILDEPITAVEPKSRDFIIKVIISCCGADSGVLITSSIATQLEKILDEVYIIHKGEIKLSSTSEDIMNTYGKTVSGFYREAFRC